MSLDEFRNLQQVLGALVRPDARPRTVLEGIASSLYGGVDIRRVSFHHCREYFLTRRINCGKSLARLSRHPFPGDQQLLRNVSQEFDRSVVPSVSRRLLGFHCRSHRPIPQSRAASTPNHATSIYFDLLSAPRSFDASAVTCDIRFSDCVRDELRYAQSARRSPSEIC